MLVLKGDTCGSVLVCRAGSAWITQEDDPADHLLRSGERFVITHKGRVVIQGYPAACLMVQHTRRTRFAAVFSAWRRSRLFLYRFLGVHRET